MFELTRMAKAATAFAATAAASDTPLSGVPTVAQAAALPIVGGTTTAFASPSVLRSTEVSQHYFRGSAIAAATVVSARLTTSPSSRVTTPIDS